MRCEVVVVRCKVMSCREKVVGLVAERGDMGRQGR